MVSLNQRLELAEVIEKDAHLHLLKLLLDGADIPIGGDSGFGIREQLLRSVASGDSEGFRRVAESIGERRITSESDWCQDDYLIFLLLLGREKFGMKLPFLRTVIESRSATSNPIPRKINEVFGAIFRQEFGIDGDFGFLKVPFLHLVGKLRIGQAEARRVLCALSQPELVGGLTPFFRLLTQKAHDLVMIERQPSAIEDTTQLVNKFESLAKELSLREWWKVLCALPGRLVLVLCVALAGFGAIPLLFGIGKGLIDEHLKSELRIRPKELSISQATATGLKLPPEITVLVKSLQSQPVRVGHRSLTLVVEVEPFTVATPAFVVEVLHLDRPLRSAFAFAKGKAKTDMSFTVIPVAKDEGRFRALVPEQDDGVTLCFALEVEAEELETVESVAHRLVLRALE